MPGSFKWSKVFRNFSFDFFMIKKDFEGTYDVIVKTKQREGQNDERRPVYPLLLSIFHLYIVGKGLTLKYDDRNE